MNKDKDKDQHNVWWVTFSSHVVPFRGLKRAFMFMEHACLLFLAPLLLRQLSIFAALLFQNSNLLLPELRNSNLVLPLRCTPTNTQRFSLSHSRLGSIVSSLSLRLCLSVASPRPGSVVSALYFLNGTKNVALSLALSGLRL